MTKQSREELLLALRPEYQKASWKLKKELLETLVAATGYSRKHAITLLNIDAIADVKTRRTRPSVYDDEVSKNLIFLWRAANMLCSKRLVPFLPEFIETLESKGHLNLSRHVRQKLLSISAATVDRLLAKERKKLGRGLSLTRAGNFLKKQIPIRTFTDWDDAAPGFFEVDLVAHCGGDSRGQFLQTLTMTDIATQWTECIALLRRGETEVITAIDDILPILPFELKGLDTDNGSEFINYAMVDWCAKKAITFTRSRQYKKNDQAHVEERNGSVVRRLVGYDRFEGISAYEKLCELHARARLFINFFQPSQKLLEKTRDGAKVFRKYDVAKTPYRRTVDSNRVGITNKQILQEQYSSLDPVALLNQIKVLQLELQSLSTSTPKAVKLDKQKKILEPRPIVEPHLSAVPSAQGKGTLLQRHILHLKPGAILRARDLLHLANRNTIDITLFRMHAAGEVKRIGRGIYRIRELTITIDEAIEESTKSNEARVAQ